MGLFIRDLYALLCFHTCLEPQTTIYKWMFGETTISYVKVWNHPIETTIYKWLFGVPGGSSCFFHVFSSSFPQFGQRSHGVSPFCRMLESAQRRIDFGAVNLGDFVGQKFESTKLIGSMA